MQSYARVQNYTWFIAIISSNAEFNMKQFQATVNQSSLLLIQTYQHI